LHKRVDSARPAPRPAGDFATLNRPKSLPAILLTARPPLLYSVTGFPLRLLLLLPLQLELWLCQR
jgi:hypothetical protein